MPIINTSVEKESRDRYLTYALSVISSRALPDVRDGLKPVQRRILFDMLSNLKLSPSSSHRKSAAVVGGVLARYHPHGDIACYEAMVRMAQDFSLRYPLVDGQGNFGSIDGDGPAAYRYTEVKLREMALEVLGEIDLSSGSAQAQIDNIPSDALIVVATFQVDTDGSSVSTSDVTVQRHHESDPAVGHDDDDDDDNGGNSSSAGSNASSGHDDDDDDDDSSSGNGSSGSSSSGVHDDDDDDDSSSSGSASGSEGSSSSSDDHGGGESESSSSSSEDHSGGGSGHGGGGNSGH